MGADASRVTSQFQSRSYAPRLHATLDELTVRFKIPRELLEAAGVRHGSDAQVRDLLGVHGRAGQNLEGVIFPYPDPRDGRVVGHRVRLDSPVEGQRYLSEQGCRHLFFPPIPAEWTSDTSVAVVVVEAEKSALALFAVARRHGRGLLPIAVGGVWGWLRKSGTELTPDGDRVPVTAPSPSLDLLDWRGRQVIEALDSNVLDRKDLQKARLALAENLAARGAQVFIASIPRRGGVNGPDDLIAVAGDEAALEMLDRAAPFAPRRKAQPNATPAAFRASASPWPEPLAAEAFYGLAGEIVRAIAPHSEADPVALLAQTLAAFGNIIGRGPYFMAEEDEHPTQIWPVLVGITSKSRKGSAWSRIRRIFAEVDSEWDATRIQFGLSSGEGLIWAVRDPIVETEIDRKTGESKEVVVDKGVEDKRLLVFEPEFASVLKVAAREGNTLSAILRQAWDRGDLQVLTKHSAAQASSALISIVGHITKDELLRYLNLTETANGFANRHIWFAVRRSNILPEGGRLDQAEVNSLAERLRAAVDFARRIGELRRDKEARAIWLKVYPDLSEGRPRLLGAVTSRAEAQVMRLAIIYALLDCSSSIRKEHLLAALALWDYAEASAGFIFGDALGDPLADEILKALRNKREGLTRTEMRDHFGRNRKAEDIERALGVLAEYGLAELIREQEGKEGRPPECWRAVLPGTTKTTETT